MGAFCDRDVVDRFKGSMWAVVVLPHFNDKGKVTVLNIGNAIGVPVAAVVGAGQHDDGVIYGRRKGDRDGLILRRRICNDLPGLADCHF